MQIPGRTPANTAMTAATLDLLSGGRFLLGLGTSGPQVVEGWHGEPWGKPLAKTREYVEIVRAVLRRETLEHHGEQYEIPYSGDGRDGARQAAEADARVRCAPRFRSTSRRLGPKNVALAVEIADGWIPIFFSPERAPRCSARAQRRREGFDIAPTVPVVVDGRRQAARDTMKPLLALYIGGMGARGGELLQRALRGATATRPRPSGSRSCISTASRAMPRPRCPTRWWTRSRSSARASGSRTGSTPGASAA